MYFKCKFVLRWIAGLAGVLILNFSFINCTPSFQSPPDSGVNSASMAGLNCGAVPGTSEPKSIDEVVQVINALPKPLSISCFLASLKRPMKVFAVDNVFSAQPSGGRDAPRIFVFSQNLVISVVPRGPGKDLVEFSEVINSTDSVKGEIAFPVTSQLPVSAPYSRILDGQLNATQCRVCHTSEVTYNKITTGPAFASKILFPDGLSRIPQPTLKYYSLNCNLETDRFRCEMLRTIFLDGNAQDAQFPLGPGGN